MVSLVIMRGEAVACTTVELFCVVTPINPIPVVVYKFDWDVSSWHWESVDFAVGVPDRKILDEREVWLSARDNVSTMISLFREVDSNQGRAGHVVYSGGKEACVNVKALSGALLAIASLVGFWSFKWSRVIPN